MLEVETSTLSSCRNLAGFVFSFALFGIYHIERIFPQVVTRDKGFRRKCRMARVREYFYGPKNHLSPDSRTVQFSEVDIYVVGSGTHYRRLRLKYQFVLCVYIGSQADQTALPIGAQSELDPLSLRKVSLITLMRLCLYE